jgi:hypothetical protein
MGASTDEIGRQINETRDHIDENLGVLERRAASNAMRYGRVAAVVLGVVAVAGAGVLIYRRVNRPSRRERLQGMLIEALKELPDTLRDLPDEVTARLKKPLPSIQVGVNGKEASKEPGTVESIVRKVAPAVFTTASGALIDRFVRPADPLDERSSRTAVPAFD